VLTIAAVQMAVFAIGSALAGSWSVIWAGALAVIFGWEGLMYHRARQ
jgi:hypothetical protein